MCLALGLAVFIGISCPAGAQNKKKIPADLFVKVGARYDSNVQLEALDVDLYANEADFAGVVYLSGRYRLVDQKQFEIGVGYSHYQTTYSDIEGFDLIGNVGQLSGKYRWGDFTFGLTCQPSLYLLDNSRFAAYYMLKPDVMWKARKNLIGRLAYSYTDINNYQDDNRDGKTNTIDLDVYYIFSKKGDYLFTGLGYDKDDGVHNDYELSRMRLKLGASFNLRWQLNMVVTAKWDGKYYANVDSFFAIQRRDNRYFLSLSVSRPILYQWLSVVLDYAYTFSESNISDYEYQKNEVALSLAAKY